MFERGKVLPPAPILFETSLLSPGSIFQRVEQGLCVLASVAVVAAPRQTSPLALR